MTVTVFGLKNVKTGNLLSIDSYSTSTDGDDFEASQVFTTYTLRDSANISTDNVYSAWLVNYEETAKDVLKKARIKLGAWEDGCLNDPIFATDINLFDIRVVKIELNIKDK